MNALETRAEQILDLSRPCNYKGLQEIDWEKVKTSRGPGSTVESLFLVAICNYSSCPIGWDKCRGYRRRGCHYYALLETVEAIRNSEVR